MVKKVVISFVVAYSVSLSLFSQNNDSLRIAQETVIPLPADSTTTISLKERASIRQKRDSKYTTKTKNDTIAWVESKIIDVDKATKQLLESTKPFKPDPTKAVIYSAIFPGLGQIYNRKYWKLPIVYGGFLGFVYAITWNGRLYGDYTKGYKAIMSDNYLDPDIREDYIHIFATGTKPPEEWDAAQLNTFRTALRSRRDYVRRNRDLSIIGAVALYTLCMIDAYVDAQLYDFDISPDLSFRIEPKIETDVFSQKSFGLQCSIKF